MIQEDWAERAGRELAGLAGADGAWGYRAEGTPSVEPTVLAALALRARTGEPLAGAEGRLVRRSAEWLVGVQRRDGSLGLSATQPTPGWTTPYGVLLWRALGVHDDAAGRAVAWLLEQKGRTLSPSDDPSGVAGHDTMLVGWPWVGDTHSWLEPTALAVLALGVAGQGGHPRVLEGLRLIRDRAVRSGGWNYGNRAVYGHPLRAQPAPTGLALLALATTGPRTRLIDAGIRYLEETLPGVRAPMSLGWGLIGLRAWGMTPSAAREWLREAYLSVTGRPDAAPRVAPLILADACDTLSLFGRAGAGEASDVHRS